MIKSLQIKNFQSHKDSFLEFSPNVTAIVGHNNQGKSAVFRALVKVMRNDPKGDKFIMDTPKKEVECQIVLETEKDRILRQIRGDNSSEANLYEINKKDKFVKFGNEIPLEVREVLQISDPQMFGEVIIDLNFQHQLDDRFLVTGSGVSSIRGKVLGRTTGVDNAQRALQLVVTEKRKKMQEKLRLEKEKEETVVALLEYNKIEEKEKELNEVKQKYEHCISFQDRIEKLKNLLERLKGCVQDARKVKLKFSSLENVEYCFDILEKINVVKKKLILFRNLLSLQVQIFEKENLIKDYIEIDLSKIELLSKRLKVLNSFLKITERVDRLKIQSSFEVPEFQTIEQKVKNCLDLVSVFNQMQKVLKEASKWKETFENTNSKLHEVEQEIAEIKVVIKEKGFDRNYQLKEEEREIINLIEEELIAEEDENKESKKMWLEKGFELGISYSIYKFFLRE